MRMCILEKIIDLKDITVKYGENVVLDKLNLYINKKAYLSTKSYTNSRTIDREYDY